MAKKSNKVKKNRAKKKSLTIQKNVRSLVFYSPQGGTGKSTLALSTATMLAEMGKKVMLVDMSVYGGIASQIREPQKGKVGLDSIITHLELERKKNDKGHIKGNLHEEIREAIISKKINGSKLDFLISSNPIKMELLNYYFAEEIINAIRDLFYEYVIFDTSSELGVKNMILLDKVDRIIIPMIQDISCGWKMVLLKDILSKYAIKKEKMKMLINKSSKHAGFNNLEFEGELGYKIIGEVSFFAKNFQNQINEGRFIVEKFNRKAYKEFKQITKEIIQGV